MNSAILFEKSVDHKDLTKEIDLIHSLGFQVEVESVGDDRGMLNASYILKAVKWTDEETPIENKIDKEVIYDKRRTGKTTKAIKESARTGKYIIAPNEVMCQCIFDTASKMNIIIPFPIAISEWGRVGVGNTAKKNGVILDEGLLILEKLLDTKVHMMTISER